jgi:hypothetical protein
MLNEDNSNQTQLSTAEDEGCCFRADSTNSYLKRSEVVKDQYACVVQCNSYQTSVHCYVLSNDDKRLFQQNLELFDRIEGYKGLKSPSNFYDQTVLKVELSSGSDVKAHDYQFSIQMKRVHNLLSYVKIKAY